MSKTKKRPGANRTGDGPPAAERPDQDSAAAGASVEKIRDIIFGNQMRDYEKRFARIEERLLAEIQSLRDETGKRLDAVERFAKKELESLAERVSTEQNNRADALKKVSQDLQGSIKTLSSELAQLVAQQARDAKELRAQMLDQSKSLMDEIRQRNKEAASNAERGLAELRSDKLDRAVLAELLMEMAVRMSDELAGKLNEA